MSGSGGSGGYEYQARVTAYVAAHILTKQKLGWIEHSTGDIPIAVAAETNGVGDDIKITLEDSTTVEVQVKHGLKKDQDFWDAIVKLGRGLAGNPSLYCILVTDSTASGTFKDQLRKDLKRLGQGRNDDLKEITKEVIKKFAQNGILNDKSLFRRLLLIVVDLEDDAQGAKSAQVILSQFLADKNQESLAWKILVGDGITLMTNRGRRDAEGIARLLSSKSIQLSANSSNPAITAELYRKWLKEKTSDLIVLGSGKDLSIEKDWITLRAKKSNGDQTIFKAESIPELYHRTVVVGDPGSGKSNLVKRLAHQLSVLEKKVLLVKLTPDKKFEELISFDDLAKKFSVDKNELSVALSYPDYLLVDGLDEYGDRANIANVADALTDWAKIHSITKIIVTTRIGYEPELFPGWENVEIQPLEKSDILNFSKKLLEDSLSNTETIEDKLTAFDKWLQNTKTSLLVARNPLLLGFLIQLFKIDVEIIQNRADLYKLIIAQFISRPVQNREPLKFGKREAQRILTISGWKLLNEPEISEEELLEKIIEELEFKGYTQQEAEKQAESGINFWENRRIFERSRERHQDTINFIHLTLCEYAAAKYVSDLDDQKICKWLDGVRQDITWQEVILFAAGLGKVEIIVNHLLQLDNLENTNSTDILLAAKALTEVNDAPFELIKAVVERLQIRLESPNHSVVFQASEALLSLIYKATDIIGNIAQSLSNHTQSWKRIVAIRLVLECGDKYVDLNILRKVLDECVSECVPIPEQKESLASIGKTKHISLFPETRVSKRYGRLGERFYNEVLRKGYQFLLEKEAKIEITQEIEELISKGYLMLKSLLKDYAWNKLNSLDKIDYQEKQNLWRIWTKFTFSSILHSDIGNPLKRLESLKDIQLSKYAEKAFLEAVIRASHSKEKLLISHEELQNLITLGVLFQGMGFWEIGNKDWDILSQCHDLDAVDSVIKGAIIAMNLKPQKIAMEAELALEQIQFYEDLDIIESALKGKKIKSEHSSQTFDWAWDKMEEISNQNYISLFSKIPQVPADPEWERAREIDISPEHLVRALKHPSEGIYQNATLLLMNGVGGSEAINLIEELFKENKDNEQVVWAVSNIAPHLLEDE